MREKAVDMGGRAEPARGAPSEPPKSGTTNDAAKAGTPNEAPKGGAPNALSLERNLDELVIQLRQQNRNAQLRPDFSFSHVMVLIVQAFAIVTLVIGFFKYFTMRTALSTAQDIQLASLTQTQALLWVMIAVFLQGVVVALLVYTRSK